MSLDGAPDPANIAAQTDLAAAWKDRALAEWAKLVIFSQASSQIHSVILAEETT